MGPKIKTSYSQEPMPSRQGIVIGKGVSFLRSIYIMRSMGRSCLMMVSVVICMVPGMHISSGMDPPFTTITSSSWPSVKLYITLYYTLSHYIASHYVTIYSILSLCIKSKLQYISFIILLYVMFHYTIFHYFILCYIALPYIISNQFILIFVTLYDIS